MWGIFSKKQKEIITMEEKVPKVVIIDSGAENVGKATISNYPLEVISIHREFDIAAEDFLQQCKNIIEIQPEVNKSKIETLKNLGFKQVKEFIEGSEIISKVELSKEQIELVTHYQQHYPYNKFITEDQVKQICHKYNLVCGDVGRFTGFVPEKNLKEIGNFKLKESELQNLIVDETYEGKTTVYKSFRIKSFVNNNYLTIASVVEAINSKKLAPASGEYIFNNNLKICAPVKDMDIRGLELKEGYKLEKVHIPDPVVLQTVKGGYLILTAWGDEASDPLVVNQNHN